MLRSTGGPCLVLAGASFIFARHPLAIATAISQSLLCRPRRTDRSEIVRSSAACQSDCRADTCRKGTGDEPEN
jgi:hypothetical protein